MFRPTEVLRLFLALAILTLSACGGGGGGPKTPPTPPLVAPTGLGYPSPQSYSINVAISPLSPTVTGLVTSYSIAPALPAGLSFNTTRGVITGTPTVGSPQTSYTVTAANSAGSTTFALSITVPVSVFVPSLLSYPSPTTLSVGVAMTPLPPNGTCLALVCSSVGVSRVVVRAP